jgi:putative endopeptidase
MNSRLFRKVGIVLACLGVFGCVSKTPPKTSEAKPAEGKPAIALPSIIDESALDKAIDPCEDFYEFACGGWIKKTEIPPDRPAWSRGFYEIDERNEKFLREILEKFAAGGDDPQDKDVKKLGDYYAACMDESKAENESMQTLEGLLKSIDTLKNVKQLPEKLAELHLQGSNAFFNFSSFQDFRDSTQMISAADQGGLGLPDRDYYLKNEGKMPEVRKLYREHVTNMLKLLGVPAAKATKQADTILKFETSLAKASMSRVDRRDPMKIYHRMMRADLQKMTPRFAWTTYLDKLGYSDVQAINVLVPGFFTSLNQMFGSAKTDDIRTYLKWHLLEAATSTLGKKFVDERFRFTSKALNGTKELPPRWKRCVSATSGAMGEPLGRHFVTMTYGEAGKLESQKIVRNIEAAFEGDLKDVAWMDDNTRKEAAEKLHKLVNQIGYPDKWRNFGGLEVSRESYLKNALAAAVFNNQYDLNKIGKPADRTEWDMSPQTVNAYYSAENNKMVFPAGILQTPFFNVHSSLPANYGAMGMVVGHELTHGFDDEGKQFDANGNLRNWWTPNVEKEFNSRTDCLVKQYEGYVPLENLHLNGKLTLGENIADQGGIRLAYAAMKTAQPKVAPVAGFNEDQQFFIGFAQSWCSKERPELARMKVTVDPHSPAHYRVIGPLSNFPKFADAFRCKAGSKMVRQNACTVW